MITHSLIQPVVAALSLFVAPMLAAQGTFFVNLNFESPLTPLEPAPGGPFVTIRSALPGWTGYIDDIQVDRVLYNTIALDSAAISFHGQGSLIPLIEGQYRVYLQSGFVSGNIVGVAIGQAGTIPPTVQSVRFLMARAAPRVSFAGQQLPTYLLGTGPGEALLYGADVSQFMGQTGELRFGGGGILDRIFFSSEAVPEPSTFVLFGVGLLLVGRRLHRRR